MSFVTARISKYVDSINSLEMLPSILIFIRLFLLIYGITLFPKVFVKLRLKKKDFLTYCS